MTSSLRVTCLQVNAGSDWQKNLEKIKTRLSRILKLPEKSRPDLIALPEMFYWRGSSGDLAEVAGSGTPAALALFQDLAKRSGVNFLLGSLLETSSARDRFYNTSFFISSSGKIAAKYRKIHLFDIGLKQVSLKESSHILPGRKIVTCNLGEIRMGLTVCYDLRFPELYRALSAKGCEIIFVPSNFTYHTGKAHWEVLLRARAIENQVFIVAPAQSGANPSTGVMSFGTSLIVSPWGEILAKAGPQGEGAIKAILDTKTLRRLRKGFPVLSHRRLP